MSFADPLELFRAAVERLNADDFSATARCCDPVSLRSFQRGMVGRYSRPDHVRVVNAEEYMRMSPDIPREAAEYSAQPHALGMIFGQAIAADDDSDTV